MVRKRYSPRFTFKRRAAYFLSVLALSAATGCAKPDGSATPLTSAMWIDAAPTVNDDIRRDYQITASNGDSIAISAWLPDDTPRAVILAVHGYGDYGPLTFAEAAKDWAERDIATYAYDQRGFGRNPSNSNWPGHQALVDDLEVVSRLVRERHPTLPLIVIGHSMGGAVVAAASGEGRIEANKVVLLAPAFWGGAYLGTGLRAMASLAHAFAPDKRWSGDGIIRIQASDNIEMLRGLGRDPLYVRKPSSREFVGLIRIMDRAVEASDQVELPALVIYGAKDQVVPEEPIKAAFQRFSGQKRYVNVETGWHMLLRDLGADKVRDLVADFALDPVATD